MKFCKFIESVRKVMNLVVWKSNEVKLLHSSVDRPNVLLFKSVISGVKCAHLCTCRP